MLQSSGMVQVHPRPARRLVALCALAALLLTGGVERKAATLNREATAAYEAAQFEEATQLYSDALTRAPESNGISYNLGNALYRDQRLEEAMSNLARAAQTDDPTLRHSALYNLGNTLFRMGKLPEAVDAYRRALDVNPTDLDTKINFEKALRLLEEQQQDQQQQQQQQDNQEQQDGEQGPKNEQGDEQQEQEQQEGDQQEQQESQDQDGEEESDPSASEPQEPQQPEEQQPGAEEVAEGELRYEEALRILEAMRDQEKEQQKAKAQKMRARAKRGGKDW